MKKDIPIQKSRIVIQTKNLKYWRQETVVGRKGNLPGCTGKPRGQVWRRRTLPSPGAPAQVANRSWSMTHTLSCSRQNGLTGEVMLRNGHKYEEYFVFVFSNADTFIRGSSVGRSKQPVPGSGRHGSPLRELQCGNVAPALTNTGRWNVGSSSE